MRERPRPTPVPTTPALVRPRRFGVQASLVVTLAGAGCGNDDEGTGNNDDSADDTLPPMPGPASDEGTMSASDDTASTTGIESTGESVTDPTIAPMPNPTETDDATLDGTGSSTTTDGSDDGTSSGSSSSSAGDDESTTAIPPMPPPMNDPIEPYDDDDEVW